MAPYDEGFARLKAGDETRKIARSLYLQASELTKPGSGRGLGLGQSALCAVCAFLASKRLGNGEVTRDQACAVACVDPKTFDSTLAIVKSVLQPSSSSPRLRRTNITYRSLLKQYVPREDAFVPMVEVEDMLKGCEASVDGRPIDPESSLMQCAIFYWVCNTILRVAVPDATHLRQMLKVSPRTWSASQRVLENHCSHMTDDLIQKAETALSARTSRSQTRIATTDKIQTTPSARATRAQMQTPSKEKIQASLTHLRALPGSMSSTQDTPPVDIVAFDNTPMTSTGRSDTASSTSPTRSSRATVRTRFHAFKTSSTQDSPPVAHVAFDSTPTTSPGMSDTTSPALSTDSRIVVRARVHVPLAAAAAAKRLSYPIQEEEMPRRRRRNLRAAFLDPGAYGWKPAARTVKKLQRARNWESLMISKYGDPWDTW